jgi:LacI family transcriptional regulator
LIGFRKAFDREGIDFDSNLISGDDFSEASGYWSTCKLLDTYLDVTAVFALSNQNALGALRAFSERRLKVPQDISLVTFDDAPFAEYLASPLSVVRQDIEEIGHRAAELLIEQIRTGKKPQQSLHRVPVKFIERESIGPPKQLPNKAIETASSDW